MGFILHSSLCGATIQRVAETMLLIHHHFGYCWRELAQHQGFFSFQVYPSCPSSKLAGGGYRVWRGPGQERWPHMTKGTVHITWCSAAKAQGKEVQGRTFMIMVFVFPNNCYTWWSLAFLAKRLPAAGKQWMNFLFCFTCTCNICFPYLTHYLLLLYLYFLPDPQQRRVRRLATGQSQSTTRCH